MAVNKGLTSLANSTPNFSNQALENAINDIKAIDLDDGHQFILSQFLLDEAIRDNTVLTISQKNDVLDTLYNAQPHLQIGRYLNDLKRHTNTILDGTILGFNETIGDFPQGSFLEIMQLTLGLQGLIPSIYGVPAREKRRSVNDHLGILNNMFTTTEDSSAPVFSRLKTIMQLIDTNSRNTSALNLAVTNAATANLNLRTFINGVVADSTDFQTSLDNRVASVVSMFSTLNTRISEIAGDPTSELQEIRDTIVTQQSLENSNITSLRDYSETVSKNLAFASLAEDPDLRQLMSRVAQNENWKSYFDTYELNQGYLNSALDTDTDSDKSSVIDSVLTDLGLPDVLDSTNLQAVADKAKRDDRIDTTNYDRFTVQQQIIKSCEQLLITTANIDILSLSASLLNNMNQHDRDKIAEQLDLNESANTLS
mgnify:FL=1